MKKWDGKSVARTEQKLPVIYDAVYVDLALKETLKKQV